MNDINVSKMEELPTVHVERVAQTANLMILSLLVVMESD
jgi:hypothetical protein